MTRMMTLLKGAAISSTRFNRREAKGQKWRWPDLGLHGSRCMPHHSSHGGADAPITFPQAWLVFIPDPRCSAANKLSAVHGIIPGLLDGSDEVLDFLEAQQLLTQACMHEARSIIEIVQKGQDKCKRVRHAADLLHACRFCGPTDALRRTAPIGLAAVLASALPHTFLAGAPDGRLRLLVGPVEDGDAEALVRHVERQVLQRTPNAETHAHQDMLTAA